MNVFVDCSFATSKEPSVFQLDTLFSVRFLSAHTNQIADCVYILHTYIFFIFSIRSHFTSLHFDSNRLLMRFFFNWKRLCSLFLLLLPLYFCWLPYFVNGFFCIVNWMAEASLEVMTSFMHLDNNYFCLKDRHLHVRALELVAQSTIAHCSRRIIA